MAVEECEACSAGDVGQSEGVEVEDFLGFHLFFLGSKGRALMQLVVLWVHPNLQR